MNVSREGIGNIEREGNADQSAYHAAGAVLEFFNGEIRREVEKLISTARSAQSVCKGKGRIHVLYESFDEGTITGDVNRISVSELRVLFSEKIKFEGERKYAAASLRLSTAVSLFSMLQDDPNDEGSIGYREAREFHIPLWYPGKEFLDGPQLSKSEVLLISAKYVNMLEGLGDEESASVYYSFFEGLHKKYVERDPVLPGGRMKYWRFTAPWICLKLKVGTEIILMNGAVIPKAREGRSPVGYKRLRWILAAFVEQEKQSHFQGLLISLVRRQSERGGTHGGVGNGDKGRDVVDLTGAEDNTSAESVQVARGVAASDDIFARSAGRERE